MLLRLVFVCSFSIFISLTLISSASFAKSSYSIPELLELAKQNSAVKAAQFSAIAKQKFANQELYWQNPRTRIASSGLQKDYSLVQTVPFFSKLRKKYEAQASLAKAANMQKNNLALEIQAELFGLLYEYQALQKKIELAALRIKRLTLVDNYLSSIVLSSPTQKAQARITKDKIKLISQEMLMTQNQLYLVWQQANQYLGLENEPKIEVVWLSGKSIPSRNKMVAKAVEQNFTIREQKYLLESMQNELAFAKVEQMPDFELEVNQQDRSARDGQIAQKDNGLALSLSIPLFNRNQEKVLAANSNLKAAEFELDFQKKVLLNQILSDIKSFETAVKIAEIFYLSDKFTKKNNNQNSQSQLPKIGSEADYELANIAKFDRMPHLDRYISSRIRNLNSANDNFKKGILEFITYIELDSQEYQMINSALDNQVALAMSYGGLMVRIGDFLIPKLE